MRKLDLSRWNPPGFRAGVDRTAFWLCEAAAVLYAAVIFSDRYGSAKANLYQWIGGHRLLTEGAMMPYFTELLPGTMRLFLLGFGAMLILVLAHYGSYRRGSMSIYLMKRLPDRSLIHRQCWTLPLLGTVLYLLTAAILVGIFYLIYRFATPAVCLPELMGR